MRQKDGKKTIKGLLPGLVYSSNGFERICVSPFGLWWAIRWELSSSLPADVIVAAVHLPGELGHGGGRVSDVSGWVQAPDVVAVFGRVIFDGASFGAFLAAQLHDRQHASIFTDHPVLKRKNSQHIFFFFKHINVLVC